MKTAIIRAYLVLFIFGGLLFVISFDNNLSGIKSGVAGGGVQQSGQEQAEALEPLDRWHGGRSDPANPCGLPEPRRPPGTLLCDPARMSLPAKAVTPGRKLHYRS